LGLTLQECIQKLSHREYLTWKEYFKIQWNEPSRGDWYLRQIAAEVYKSRFAEHIDAGPDKFELTFEFNPSEQEEVEQTQAQVEAKTKASKSHWGGIAGVKL